MPAARPQPSPDPTAAGLEAFRERLVRPRAVAAASKAEWLRERAALRDAVRRSLGLEPLPDRLPLEVRTGPAREEGGCRLERVAWCTWPRVWARALLVRPAGEGEPARASRPAVLLTGSAERAALDLLPALARRGVVGLAVDLPAGADPAVGLYPATVAAVNHLRGLDLLAGLPEVSRERLAVVGLGEGVDLALQLLALDDRPRALALAAPGGRYGARAAEAASPWVAPGLLAAADFCGLAAIPSPRAALYVTTGVAGERFAADELGEIRAVYRLWGQADRLHHRHLAESDAASLLAAVEAWLAAELEAGPPGPATRRRPALPEDPAVEDEGFAGIRAWFHRRVAAQPPQLESRPSRRSYQEGLRDDLWAVLGGLPPPEPASAEIVRRAPGEWRVTLRTEGPVRLPGLWLHPEGAAAGSLRVLLAAHPDGGEAALAEPLVAAARATGWAVLAPDVRFHGALARDWSAACLLAGRPEAVQAAVDLRACVRWLAGLPEVDGRGMVVAGFGALGISALLAGVADERAAAVVADCRGTLYRDGGEALPPLPNVLRVADVPQIAALLAPRALCLYNAPPERLGFSSRRYLDWVKRTYQSLGELDALRLTPGPAGDPPDLLAWLDSRLRRQRKGTHRSA